MQINRPYRGYADPYFRNANNAKHDQPWMFARVT